jgi:Ser/Thr protein kinase RdoA (MazF antagonist)
MLVARCWPPDGPDREALTQIHGWLSESGDLGFVPVPISTIDGQTIVLSGDRLWEVTPWMKGDADLSRPPARSRLRAAFAAMAAFHARLASNRVEGPSPGLAYRVAEIEGLLLRDFDEIRNRVGREPADPVSAMTRRWLDRAVVLAPPFLEALRKAAARPLPLQPCLRDARPDHFLFEGERLSGLVDFGAMGRDSLAGDLARLLAEGVGPDRSARRKALEAFEAIRPLSEAEIRSIEAFEQANALLGAGRWARWHFLDGRPFDDPQTVLRGLQRGLSRLEEFEARTR